MDRTEETAMKLYNLEQVEVIRDPLTSTKCLVAWGPDTILVAFRGTANRQNAALDVKVTCTTLLFGLSGVGCYSASRVVCTELKRHLRLMHGKTEARFTLRVQQANVLALKRQRVFLVLNIALLIKLWL